MENRPLLRQLGENVRQLRKARGLSLADVSSRMKQLGVPLSLNGVSKVELSNRDVSLDELAALAAALQVPPVLLVFPLGRERVFEVFPGTRVDTWDAVKWFTGEETFPASEDGAPWAREGAVVDQPTAYFREQDRLIAESSHFRVQAAMARNQVGTRPGRPDIDVMNLQQAEWSEGALRTSEDQLRRHRAMMRKVGIDPGELPAALSDLEA